MSSNMGRTLIHNHKAHCVHPILSKALENMNHSFAIPKLERLNQNTVIVILLYNTTSGLELLRWQFKNPGEVISNFGIVLLLEKRV